MGMGCSFTHSELQDRHEIEISDYFHTPSALLLGKDPGAPVE
jgi:hypothetical protein